MQPHDLVELMQAAAHVARVLHDAEPVRVRSDPDISHILLHVAGQTAAVAGEDEADSVIAARVGDLWTAAHHDDVGVSKLLCDVLCHVKAVAGA